MAGANSFDRALAFHRNALQLFAAAACAMTTANKITVVRIVMIPAFNRKMIEEFAEGPHKAAAAA